MLKKMCQSCGIPLKKDRSNSGTEKDGNKSKEYCFYCYVEGDFTQPDWSLRQMQDFVNEKLRDLRIPFFLRPMMSNGIPKLRRWNPGK